MVSSRGFVLLALVSFACNWDFYSIIPSIFQRAVLVNQGLGNCSSVDDVKLSASTGEIYGWTVGAFPIASLVFSVAFGIFNDKIGTRFATSFGMLLMCCGNVIFLLRHSTITTAVAGRAVTGAGAACRVACLGAISKKFQGPERGAKIGLWFAAGIVSMVIGPMFAAAVSSVEFWEVSNDSVVAFVSASLEFVIAVAIAVIGIDNPASSVEVPLNAENAEASDYGADQPAVVHSQQVFNEVDSPKDEQSVDNDTISPKFPKSLKALMFANFIFTLCITTFEATLVPMLQSRFNSSKTIQSLTFGGIGLCVLLSSALVRLLEAKGLSKWGVIFCGSVVFLIGTVASVDFSGSKGLAISLEVISCILCASGFTFAAVKIPDLFAGHVIASGELYLKKMGQLMGLLSMGGSLARALGPIALGYGLHLSVNAIIIGITIALALLCTVLAFSRRILLL